MATKKPTGSGLDMSGIKKTVIYLSGPMSGIPDFNFPAFNAAAADLRKSGYEVLNPAENDKGSTHKSWEYYMKQDLPNVCKADWVMCLPNWETSKGSGVEVALAMLLRIPVFAYDDEVSIFERIEADPAIYLVPKDIACVFGSNCKAMLNDARDGVAINQYYSIKEVKPSPTPQPLAEKIKEATETVLQEADRLVSTDRQGDYGHPIVDFTRTALIWTGLLLEKLKPGVFIQPEDIGLCMVGLKLSRETNKRKRDNRVDGAGYFKTEDLCIEARDQGRMSEWLNKMKGDK